MNITFLEKLPLLEKIHNNFGVENANKFLTTVRNSHGLSKELFDNFLTIPEAKYAQARFILNMILSGFSARPSSYLGYLRECKLISNLKQAPIKIKSIFDKKCQSSKRKFVIFLDGDNLSNLLTFSKLKELSSDIDFHVCLVLSKDIINDSMMGYEQEEWISIIFSETKEHDAADNCIAFLMARVDCKMEDNNLVDFVLVTRDHFHREMISQFENCFDRICHHAHDMNDLVSILENKENVKRPRSHSNQDQENCLNSIEIMKLDQEEPNSDFLIEFFKNFWIGSGKSQSQYCKSHILNPTNFSKHLNRKKFNTGFNMKLFEYYSSYFDKQALSNHVIRIDKNVVSIHVYENGENGEISLIGNSHQHLTKILTTGSRRSQCDKQSYSFSIHNTGFVLEIDGENVSVQREIDQIE